MTPYCSASVNSTCFATMRATKENQPGAKAASQRLGYLGMLKRRASANKTAQGPCGLTRKFLTSSTVIAASPLSRNLGIMLWRFWVARRYREAGQPSCVRRLLTHLKSGTDALALPLRESGIRFCACPLTQQRQPQGLCAHATPGSRPSVTEGKRGVWLARPRQFRGGAAVGSHPAALHSRLAHGVALDQSSYWRGTLGAPRMAHLASRAQASKGPLAGSHSSLKR
jgi:hypothetical protein